jgi:molybdenum cofactor cytidylyltransferase
MNLKRLSQRNSAHPPKSLSTGPTIVVLCAGRSQRFRESGGSGSKLDALIGGKSVRDRVVEVAKKSDLPLIIVNQADTAHLPNPGMGDSIANAVSRSVDSNGWLILPADLAMIQIQTIVMVASALQANEQQRPGSADFCVAPRYQNQRGHPVGFSRDFLKPLLSLSGDEGAKRILSAHPPVLLDVEDEGCVLDVDTPQLLEQARELWRGRAAKCD